MPFKKPSIARAAATVPYPPRWHCKNHLATTMADAHSYTVWSKHASDCTYRFVVVVIVVITILAIINSVHT